jgi:hypothetical protein
MSGRIETIFAEVVSHKYLWLETVVERWQGRGVPDYGDPRVIRLGDEYRTSFGHKDHTTSWQDLVDLAFRFDDDPARALAGFYATEGPLGDPLWQRMMPGLRERIGWARAALGWFRQLTVLVSALQNGRVGQLWEFFGEPRELRLGDYGPIYLSGPHPQGDPSDLAYSIRWVATLDKDDRCFTPQNEAELLEVTWRIVSQAVEYELSQIPLSLINRDVSRPAEPHLLWGFSASGAFHEGFLDWFFRIFAPFKVTTCHARGCKNPVLPPKSAYCSPECRSRQKQQDYRDRIKKTAGRH